jgi:fucose permease
VGHLCVCFSSHWPTFSDLFKVFPLFYLQLFAETHGLSEDLAFYTVSIANAASVFGRVLPNFMADKLGVFNMLIIASTCAGIICLAWMAATSTAGVIVIAILFGFFSGAYVSLIPGCFQSLRSVISLTQSLGGDPG